jgi:hypothetical protein
MTDNTRADIDTKHLPPPPDLVPGSMPPPTPEPNKPLGRKATEYNGSPITDRNEPDPGTFEPQDDTPEVMKKREGPKPT